VVDDVPDPAARRGRHPLIGPTRLTVRVHPRARAERLEWDGSTLQLWVHEPPAGGRANAAVIRAAAAAVPAADPGQPARGRHPPIDPQAQTPAAWRDYVARRTCLPAPGSMTEGAPARFAPFKSGYDPGDPAIMATRNKVFPLHGLMP